MNRFRRRNLTAYALFANAIMLGLILIVLLSRDDSPRWLPAAMAQTPTGGLSPQPIAGGAGLFLMPAQFFTNAWGCYIMDVDAQTLSAYQYFPAEKKLRLIAARTYFKYDRKLGNFNTDPDPLEVKALVEKEQAGERVNNPEAPPPAPPEAPK